jgi:hypothetical protein
VLAKQERCHLGETCSTLCACCRDIGVCLMQFHISQDDVDKVLQASRLQASRYSCAPESRGRYVESTTAFNTFHVEFLK